MSEENKNRSDSDFKFPSEIIDLPSGGKLYPKDSPLKKGKIEMPFNTEGMYRASWSKNENPLIAIY